MKIFKYKVNYDSKGDVTGTIEHIEDLEVMSKRDLVKQIVAAKHGLDISKMSSNFYVTRDKEAEKGLSNNESKQTNSPTKNTNTDQGSNLGTGLGNLASGLGNGVGGAISGTLSGVGNLAGKGFDSLNKELDKGVADNKAKRKAIEEKANEISKIEFGSSIEEMQSQIEQLISYGNTLSSEQNPIKKAVYSKVTFGIMRLKGLGANDTASFFETESKKIKPNLWNAIWFWATFSNT